MGGSFSAYGGEERHIQGFGWGNLKERDHLGDPGVGRKILLRWIFRKWGVRVWTGWNWLMIRDRCRALVSAVMNLRVP